MTVTRCVVQLADGSTGHSYVAGRSKPHAELAALADALLQGPQGSRWMALVDALEQEQDADRAARAAQSAETKEDFTTLVREIGRASCRERMCQNVSFSVVYVSLQTKKQNN